MDPATLAASASALVLIQLCLMAGWLYILFHRSRQKARRRDKKNNSDSNNNNNNNDFDPYFGAFG